MHQETLIDTLRNSDSSLFHRILDYENYVKQRKLATNQKFIFNYKGIKLAFTQKQVSVLKLVTKGYSNIKIAQILNAKEATIKLLTYRLMKYLEAILYEKIDRYYLVVIAQGIEFGKFFPTTLQKL